MTGKEVNQDMLKKILIILAFVIVLGAGAGCSIYFYIQNQNQIEMNQMLAAQNAQVQSQLNAIGAMTTVYEVNTKVYGGNMIKEEDLIAVSIPVSATGKTSITDMTDLLGKFYKVSVEPGTILTTDMLMDELDDSSMRYTREILLQSVPVTTQVGDFIDVRMMLPNGEDYVVFSHKRIELLYDNVMTIKVSEEEHQIWNSALIDLSTYSSYGLVMYVTKYLEPGVDIDTIAMYPVQHDMENWIRFNPNITDTTRCINETLRDHIDEILFVFSSSKNASVSTGISGIFSTHMSAQVAAQQQWKVEYTDEEGNMTWDGFGSEPVGGEGGSSSDFEGAVGDAMSSLEQDLGDLEAIQ